MEDIRHKLARRIREMMSSTHVDTQSKVAEKSNTSQATVHRILSCDQATTIDVLSKIAKAFSIKNPAHLLLDEDELQLLSAWNQLSESDKSSILGFINVKSSRASAPDEKHHFKVRSDDKKADEGGLKSVGQFKRS